MIEHGHKKRMVMSNDEVFQKVVNWNEATVVMTSRRVFVWSMGSLWVLCGARTA